MTEQEFLNTKWSKASTVVMKVTNRNAIASVLNGGLTGGDMFKDIFCSDAIYKDRYFHVYGVNWRTKQLKIHYPDHILHEELDDKGFLWVDYQKLMKFE